MNKLKIWYANLQQREQRAVAIGGIALCVLILFGAIMLPLESAVSSAVKTRDARTADLAWMRQNGPEVQAGSATLAPDTGEAPVVLVDRIGRETGLGGSLRGTQPSGTGVRVQLEAAPFDTLVTWMAALDEKYGFAVDSISVDRTAVPGVVNASITFAQAKH
jgi:general secretion pathway protein M